MVTFVVSIGKFGLILIPASGHTGLWFGVFTIMTYSSNEPPYFFIVCAGARSPVSFSVTRWLDYFSIFGHLQQCKLAQ